MTSEVDVEDAITVEEYRSKLAREDMAHDGPTREQRARIEALGHAVGLRINGARIETAEQAERVIASLTLLRRRMR